MPFRKIVFWIHLTAGVTAGVVILVLSATGVLLAFQKQIVAAAEKNVRGEPSAAWKAAVRQAGSLRSSSVTIYRDPAMPVMVGVGREKTLFVDRTTGRVLGEGAVGLRKFFRGVEDVHRRLAFRDARRVTGAANLLFFFILCTGLYIWFPRGMARFRGGLRGKARDFNWHNVLGIWSVLPLLLIVFSGIVLSYPWATKLIYRTLGGEAPRQQQENKGPIDMDKVERVLDSAIANATRVTPRWQSITLRLPLPKQGPVTVSVDEGRGTRPDLRSQLMLDARDAHLVEHKTYVAQSRGQKARAWLRWIHTGEAAGIAGQGIAMLASAAATVLVWTGISLALRRLRNRIRKERLA